MGRREDGAAVKGGGDLLPSSPGRRHREIRPSTDAAPRASGQRTPKRSGDGGAPLAGNKTCRQELADRRGWSTFLKARPAHRQNAARGAPGGASFLHRNEGTPSQSVPPGGLAHHPPGASRASASAGAPLPSREPGIAIRTAAYPAPIKECGRTLMSFWMTALRDDGAYTILRSFPRTREFCRALQRWVPAVAGTNGA